MTDSTLPPLEPDPIRRCISDVLTQLTDDYQQAQPERRALAAVLPATNDDFSPLEELELLTTDLRGYAHQIHLRGWLENESAAIEHLQTLSLFRLSTLAQLYFDTQQPYPRLKAYMRQLDYLRLLILEYLNAHEQLQSA